MLTYVKSEIAKKESNSGGKYKQVVFRINSKNICLFKGTRNSINPL